MTELKPCPFCGGKVTIASYGNYWSIIASGNEPNVSCGCRLFMESELFHDEEGKQRQKEKLIEKWNTRPNPWHTGTPTEEGWYLFKWYDDKEYWFTVEYLTSKGIAEKAKWGSFNNCKWQKIEENEDGRID